MRKAKDLFRVRVAAFMVLGTITGAAIMIRQGRQMRDAGDSLDRRGLERQAEMRQQGLEEEAARKQQQSS